MRLATDMTIWREEIAVDGLSSTFALKSSKKMWEFSQIGHFVAVKNGSGILGFGKMSGNFHILQGM